MALQARGQENFNAQTNTRTRTIRFYLVFTNNVEKTKHFPPTIVKCLRRLSPVMLVLCGNSNNARPDIAGPDREGP